MKPTDADRDLAFDRLIARGLAEETDATGNACPDADLLAAWFDRSLSVSETERIEAHAAACASCQRILADLSRSEPPVVRAAPVPAPAKPWHWHWRWLVPVATATVIVVVGARTLRAPAPNGAPASAAAARQAAAEPASPEVPLAGQVGSGVPADTRLESPPQAAKAKDADRGRGAVNAERVPAAPPPPAQAAPARADVAAERLGFNAQDKTAARPQEAASVPVLGGAASGAAAGKPSAADTVGRVEEGAAIAAPPAASPVPTDAPSRTVVMKAESRVSSIPAVATSPSGHVAWRVGAGGAIDRSADGGRTWRPQASGITATLTAASAPSDTACWAVGAGGVTLRTADGSTWERLTSPTRSNLVSVSASSQDVATIRSADGSEFATTDGGRSWQKRQ